MADKDRGSKTGGNSSTQGGTTRTPASSTATGQASTTPSGANQPAKQKNKNKKNKDAAASSGIGSSGAQIMDPAGNSGQNQKSKKGGGGGSDIIMRRPQGPNNTMEYRFDYVVSIHKLSITPKQIPIYLFQITNWLLNILII